MLHAVAVQTLLRGYRPIADYGAIGDGRSVALVASDGSVDWWCPGRFDAPSVFGAILDDRLGGRFRVGPTDPDAQSAMRYVDDANVLETTHETPSGRVRVVDFAPLPEDAGVANAVLVRRVEGLEGAVEVEVEFAPRFQYGAVAPRFAQAPFGLLARGAGEIMLLTGVELARRRGTFAARLQVRAGERLDLVLRHRPFDAPVPFQHALAHSVDDLERRTVGYWHAWSERTRATGPYAALVRRAALTLKLLQYAPNGAIVAAPTTSLPEAIGGVRNWDYRYAWIRDAALCGRALADLGHPEEAESLSRWIAGVLGDGSDGLRIMYTLSGSSDIPERELPHLSGYRNSRPVRVGNGACSQRQLDVYGELFDFLDHCGFPEEKWETFRLQADWVVRHWREPDSGIWEMRSEPRHFVLSKAMACVALRKASSIARGRGLPGDVARWDEEAAVIEEEVLRRGFDERLGAFAQAYDVPLMDASNLLLGLIGFIDPRDPRMVATVDRTMERLMANGLVYRYLDADDGLPGGEATFAYCTFWLVEALALQGRLREAREVFDGIVRRASPLGLYAEEIDAATGEHLGNFPQGFPHAGLIAAALALERTSEDAASEDAASQDSS